MRRHIDKALGEAKAVYFETDIEPDLAALATVYLDDEDVAPCDVLLKVL